MAGIRGPDPALDRPDLQAILLNDVVEVVVTHAMGAAEAIPVHLPQLVAAYTGILAPHLLDELHHEALPRQTLHAVGDGNVTVTVTFTRNATPVTLGDCGGSADPEPEIPTVSNRW